MILFITAVVSSYDEAERFGCPHKIFGGVIRGA